MILPPALERRVLADSRERAAWLDARVGNIGGSDAANYANEASVPGYVRAKLDDRFRGNQYTAHGNAREAAILAQFGIEQNTLLFRSEATRRHVATPDAIKVRRDGGILLAQVKALEVGHEPMTSRGLRPRYLRQCWWEQWVLGAERTIFIWEMHDRFQPAAPEAESVWIDRDDSEIAKLVRIANGVCAGLDAHAAFEREMNA